MQDVDVKKLTPNVWVAAAYEEEFYVGQVVKLVHTVTKADLY